MDSEALLTSEEMSALLSDNSGSMPAQDKRRKVVPYNFRRPDRLSKEQMRSLYLLHDMFSHSLSSSLPIFLRSISEVTLISVEQQAYMEYLYGLADPTVIFTLAMTPLQGVAVIEINPSVAFPIIDRMLGGPGIGMRDTRAVTDIEQMVLEGFLRLVLDDFTEVWKPLIPLNVEVVGRETRPQLLQIVAPNEVVLSIVFHVQIGDARGMMSICIPAVMLEPIMHKFTQSNYARSREIAPQQTRLLLDTLANVSFPVTAELERTTASMDDLMSLIPGDVLRLDHRLDQPIRVSVGGIGKFHGVLGARNGQTIVQISTPAGDDAAGRNAN